LPLHCNISEKDAVLELVDQRIEEMDTIENCISNRLIEFKPDSFYSRRR